MTLVRFVIDPQRLFPFTTAGSRIHGILFLCPRYICKVRYLSTEVTSEYSYMKI